MPNQTRVCVRRALFLLVIRLCVLDDFVDLSLCSKFFCRFISALFGDCWFIAVLEISLFINLWIIWWLLSTIAILEYFWWLTFEYFVIVTHLNRLLPIKLTVELILKTVKNIHQILLISSEWILGIWPIHCRYFTLKFWCTLWTPFWYSYVLLEYFYLDLDSVINL